jgi:tetratricopeptide (TPR) repeat protein
MAKRARPRPTRTSRPLRQAAARSVVSAVVTPALPPMPPPPRPSAEAVVTFEKAMEALQRHHYADAATTFRVLLDRFPAERTLLDRARVYLDLCDRELRRQPSAPRTLEERLIEATAALNNGDDDRAETLARTVVADSPDQDLALYLLAAVQARRGDQTAAIELLSKAIEASPDIRAQAIHDADFESLRALDAFRLLLQSPVFDSAAPDSTTRRVRRGRPAR